MARNNPYGGTSQETRQPVAMTGSNGVCGLMRRINAIESAKTYYKRKWGTEGNGNGEFNFPRGIAVYDGEVYVADYFNHRVQVFDTEGISLLNQTEFYAYTESSKKSLGTPDGGVSVPDDDALKNAFSGAGSIIADNIILDMRAAIETIANSGCSSYNWVDNDPNNLYYVAMGDRTKYGATGGARYTWTRTADQLNGAEVCDIDIGEIYECVLKLEDDVL